MSRFFRRRAFLTAALLVIALGVFFFLPSTKVMAQQTVELKVVKDVVGCEKVPPEVTTLIRPSAEGAGNWYLLGGGVSDACFYCGNCSICDFIKLYIWASDWLV